MLAPGSAGFRFCGDHQWLNAFLFPISAERFVSDLQQLAPAIDARIARPGDVFEIADGHVRHTAGTSEIVEMKQDDVRLIEFDPTAPIPSLADPNPDGYPVAKLEEITHRFIADEMGAFAFGADAANDPVVRLHRERGVRYAVAVVFPDLVSRWYRFDFRSGRCDLSSDAPYESAGVVHRIAVSALAGWIEHRKSFFTPARGMNRISPARSWSS
jgi:hypothetical protein